MSVVFIHFEMEPAMLQTAVPFTLDVREGRAYVSVVAFSQERLRFAFGGRVTDWVGGLFANHAFLNVRTYVRRAGERGIYFLAEWVPNRWAAVIAPPLFGLPYRIGRLDYGNLCGEVTADEGRFKFRVEPPPSVKYDACERGSLDEFLLERYAAFTRWRGWRRSFRVEHEPWPQTRVAVRIEDDGLLRARWPWWASARLLMANLSPGVEVRIGPARWLGGEEVV